MEREQDCKTEARWSQLGLRSACLAACSSLLAAIPQHPKRLAAQSLHSQHRVCMLIRMRTFPSSSNQAAPSLQFHQIHSPEQPQGRELEVGRKNTPRCNSTPPSETLGPPQQPNQVNLHLQMALLKLCFKSHGIWRTVKHTQSSD